MYKQQNYYIYKYEVDDKMLKDVYWPTITWGYTYIHKTIPLQS